MNKSILFTLLLSFGVLGCSATTPTAQEQQISYELQNVKWRLISFGHTRMAVHKGSDITFDQDGRYSGSGGCNNFMGNYELKDDTLTLKQGLSTMMACPIMSQEAKFFQAMQEVDGYKIIGDVLDLSHEGHSLLRFKADILKK